MACLLRVWALRMWCSSQNPLDRATEDEWGPSHRWIWSKRSFAGSMLRSRGVLHCSPLTKRPLGSPQVTKRLSQRALINV